MTGISVDIGIFASNEELNIEQCIKSVLKAETKIARIRQVWVVSSGSMDLTNRIVRRLMKKDGRIKLIEEATRSGKSNAINQFLRVAKAAVLVTMSADLRLTRKAIEEITCPFLSEGVGMVGAHPVVSKARKSQVKEEVELLWEWHHQVSLVQPKCGEMVAFRNIIRSIPKEAAVDEAVIEVLLRLIGYEVVYAPKAIVYNRPPRDWQDLIKQRRRVFTGHEWIFTTYNYQVVTMKLGIILRVISQYLWQNPKKARVVVRLISWEILARLLGWIDYRIWGLNPYKWNMVKR